MNRATEKRVYYKTILALALLSRLVVVFIVLFRYPRNWLFSKAPDLAYLADSLNSGRGLSSPFGGSTGPTAFLAPGYPALLALIFHILGSYSRASAAALMLIQTVFAVLTVAAIMDVARRVCGPSTANLAGTFWALSLPLLWLPAVPWETSLSALFLIGMVALALRCVDKPGKALCASIAVYCALAMLINPSLMLALATIAGWTIYRTPSTRRLQPWFCFLLFLAVFAPWPIRNARVLHAFIPLRSNFGYELWQGNHPGATGNFDAKLEPLQNKTEYAAYAANDEVAYMRAKSNLAIAYIRAYPGEFIKLSALRMLRYWTGTGTPLTSGVVELHTVVTSVLGLLGLAALFKHRSPMATLFLWPLLLLPLPYYITHPDFRFRLLLDPLLTILSACAVMQINARWRARSVA